MARLQVTLTSWWAWAAFGLLVVAVWFATEYVIETVLSVSGRRLPTIAALAVGGALLVPVRRAIIALKAGAVGKKARQAATARALTIDDPDALPAEPDGRVISLVGWVRGHGYLQALVDGKRCVGLAVRCQAEYPFVLETMHNFDLVDESGGAALVVAAGGRLLGRTNVRLSRASHDDRMFVASLDMPAGAVLTDWNAFVLRDGDPVMVVGTKATFQDLTELQHGRPPLRTGVGSAASRPLLIFPLDAERRDV